MYNDHSLLIHIVAEEIAEVPFTPGHEMVGQVSHYLAVWSAK